MTMDDLRGNPVGTAAPAALAAAEQALWRMMSFYGTPQADLDAAAAFDPHWMLPPLMQAGFLLSLTDASLHPQAQAHLDAAAALAGRADDRERAHLHALRTLIAGDWDGACNAWEALLLQHPRDALALHWAHLFDFYRGDSINLRQRVARVLPEWAPADPLRPYVLGLYAFGLEENQLYAEAEAVGRQVLASARVPWAMHAVAHVMEMQGRFDSGAAWLRGHKPDWTDGNGYAAHLAWHEALFALEGLETASALALFDQHLGPAQIEVTLQRLDAAALLWRLRLLDVDVGSRWQTLAAGWDGAERSAGLSAFNDLHHLLALLGATDSGAARRWIDRVAARAEAAPAFARAVARELGVPLMQGLLAFGEGRHRDAVDRLAPLRSRAARLGGSHAQRDLIDQTLLAAAVGAGDGALGRALLNERRAAKAATPLTAHWTARLGLRQSRGQTAR